MNTQNQCPYEGGVTVYRARVYISMLNDTIGYDDDTVCELQGIYRQSVQHSKVEIENGITIRPNPSSDIAEIFLNNHHEGICTIKITDVTGRTVYSGSFDCKEKSKKVSVASITSGIYTVTVAINSRFLKSTKLTIVR